MPTDVSKIMEMYFTRKEKARKYAREHKDKMKETYNKWKEEHKEQWLAYQREYHRNYRKKRVAK